MGGTFDPIHLGHLRAAESAREALGLASVLFVPSHTPPHRRAPGCAPHHRHAMAALATCGHPGFVVSDLEIRRAGPSYTVDTLGELHQQRPGHELVLIVGSDNLAEIPQWKQPERLRELCRFAVVTRPGVARATVPEALAGSVECIDGPTLEVSSSAVRARLRERKSVRFLVPDGVADYIEKLGLYV
jgi:nicotinate-nucleotide adenylyltransferase